MGRKAGKIHNEYSVAFGSLYADTPKAVFAAIAFSFAMRLSEEDYDVALAECVSEWRTLYQNGIVPQRPPALAAARGEAE